VQPATAILPTKESHVKYGHFDDAAREYVITQPDTPRPWSNYLGTTEYGAIITNHAGGYSFFRSAAQGRFTRMRFASVPLDQPGRWLYLRDRSTGDFWTTTWQPVAKPLTEYQSTCRHGTAYSVIDSDYSDIHTETTYFVPLEKAFEVWWVKVTNRGSTPRSLRAFTYMELASEWHVHHDQFNLQYSQYIIDCDQHDGVITSVMCPHLKEDTENFENRDQSRHSFVALVGARPTGFDTDREAFLGRYGSYSSPSVVSQGACTGSRAHGDNACGVHQLDLELAPGQTTEFIVIVGVGNRSVAQLACQAIATPEDAARELQALKTHWHGLLGNLIVRTPDPAVDSMVNVWNAYNCLITYTWSRAASLVYSGERDGLGFRDTLQDILGALPAIPEQARERLELMITGQCASGGAMPVVKPFAHRPGHEQPPNEADYRADDCLWLFDAIPAYVKETGNTAWLDKVLPFADDGSATIFAHLRRAIEFNLARTGKHGLPSGLSADWNDCLRLGPKGESVFVAMQLRHALAVYSEIADLLVQPKEAAWSTQLLTELDSRIQEHSWDGAWFCRAFEESGAPIGSHLSDEGKIYLNTQSWAVLSGAASTTQGLQAMDSVHDLLATEYGIALCEPPYTRCDPSVIRAVLFNPGMKENAGIFCHPQGWAVMAETILGRGDRAYEYLRSYLPSAFNDRAEIREIEPYVHCQSTHGRHSRRFGASRLPWLSGTASWSYVAMTQYLLGLRPDWGGLRVDPVLPSTWPGFEGVRRFRGATYRVSVLATGTGRRVQKVLVDGKSVAIADPLPLAPPGTTMSVEVQLG
jgi:N,N'-diacetylchitobiose phosphorylase